MSGIDIRGLLVAGGAFPIFQAWDAKGGLHIVKSIAARNALPLLYRVLDTDRTTIVYVEGGSFYRLISNPATENTTDSDWEEISLGSVIGTNQTLVGTWNVNNTNPALQDGSYSGDNGDYFFVNGAPSDTQVTIPGLFGGAQQTVKDGDTIVYTGDQFIVVRNNVAFNVPTELLVTQVVADISTRNALQRFTNMRVLVTDAGDDPQVSAGVSAEYIYLPNDGGADGAGFVRITNPGLSPSGQTITTTDNALVIEESGTYVYTGAGLGTWTLPELANTTKGAQIRIKNASSDEGDLIVQRGGGVDVILSTGDKTQTVVFYGDKMNIFIAADKWIL